MCLNLAKFVMVQPFHFNRLLQHLVVRLGRSEGSDAGVYILHFIPIFIFIKKLPFLADLIKNWVHFIKNSDVISLVIYQSQPKLH